MPELQQLSSAAQFVLDAYKNCFAVNSAAGRGRCPDRHAHAVNHAALIAVRYGFEWFEDDILTLRNALSSGTGYYRHSYASEIGEGHYGVGAGKERAICNISFCKAYEKAHGFAPYILKDQSAAGRRLYTGMDLEWKGQRWTVSSWGKEYSYLNLIQNKVMHRTGDAKVGDVVYDQIPRRSVYRRIEALSEDGLTVTYSPEIIDDNGANFVTKRMKLTRADVEAFNADAKRIWSLRNNLTKMPKFEVPGAYYQECDFELWKLKTFPWSYADLVKGIHSEGVATIIQQLEAISAFQPRTD